ncbi:MAG: hypothetical protein KA994_00305 [Brachymonas sp.]|nr:hypothetical protein [Brachymonas sp.]
MLRKAAGARADLQILAGCGACATWHNAGGLHTLAAHWLHIGSEMQAGSLAGTAPYATANGQGR